MSTRPRVARGGSLTRREWSGLVAGSLVAAPLAGLARQKRPDSRVAGVRIGAQTYSFRGMSLADTAAAMASIGLSYCELWQGQVERPDVFGAPDHPPGTSWARQRAIEREPLRRWRLSVPMDHFRRIRQTFDDAGVTLTAYNLTFQDDFTDAEIDRGFEMAQALGVGAITVSSPVALAGRLAPFAARHGITVAFHNHSRRRDAPGGVITADDFATVLGEGASRLAINLDIGHFNGAGFDALAYLDAHHDRIVSIHLKDKQRAGDRNVPWGEGDTPIVAVLQRLRDRKWDIPAHIEYEYRGLDAVTEVRRCYEYCVRALGAGREMPGRG